MSEKPKTLKQKYDIFRKCKSKLHKSQVAKHKKQKQNKTGIFSFISRKGGICVNAHAQSGGVNVWPIQKAAGKRGAGIV